MKKKYVPPTLTPLPANDPRVREVLEELARAKAEPKPR